MPPTLDDAWAKAEWAHGQLVRLESLVMPFVNSKPYLVTDETNADGTERVISAFSPQPPPADVPFVFGDLIHALHSALDYVVCALVESVRKGVTTSHAFPIFSSRTLYELNAPRMLRYVPYEAIKFIDSVQPYHQTDWAIEHGIAPEKAISDSEFMPLMRLYRLSIEEKHRALLVATSLFDLGGTYVSHNRTREESSGIGFRVSPSYDKVQVVIPVDPMKPDEQFGKNFAAKVALVKEGPDGAEIEGLGRMLYGVVAYQILTPIWQRGLLPLTRPRYLPPQ